MRAPRKRRRLTAILLLSFLCFTLASAQKDPKPRLVLLIVVDQFRYDYVTRFEPLFGDGGLRRLMHRGAFWINANYPYIPTKTAPGHTAIATGAPPSVTGIAGNEWIDRNSAKRITSVGDSSAKTLGGSNRDLPASPRRLEASTFGDELRIATDNRAKVIGISDKPRAAILPPGRRANAAYWLSSYVGDVISSDYYFQQLPDWVVEFNQDHPLDKYFGARWERLLPEAEYLKYAGPDSPSWENIGDAPGDTNHFPHVITGGATKPGFAYYDALDHSPFVNDVLVSFAQRAIEKEKLGADEITDVLTISLSGNDHVGHRYGPESQEVMDVTLRVDKQIATLLEYVDKNVGLQNTLVIFSSDHGVAPLLDESWARGVRPTKIANTTVMTAIHAAIAAHYKATGTNGHATDDYILQYGDGNSKKDAIINGNVYFNLDALKRDGINLDEITSIAAKAALTVPGIANAFTRSELEKCRAASGPPACLTDVVGSRVLSGFSSKLSGDLIIVQKPYVYLGDSVDPANHGTPYAYDTHVPMMLMGQGIKPGRYRQPVTPLDIAPTVASYLGIRKPDKSQGRVLREALERSTK
jgi:predicted AlkP superfamily pyrophosphatase or phosphodiesterase